MHIGLSLLCAWLQATGLASVWLQQVECLRLDSLMCFFLVYTQVMGLRFVSFDMVLSLIVWVS